ncbi:MAG TPA: hypothetical protein VGM07_17130 [Stellaceae bacterium]|jgi:aspartokinase-like uncharacterized kinase
MFALSRNALVNLAVVERIEEVRSTRGCSLICYSVAGGELAVLPAPYRLPDGFLELRDPRQVRHRRASDVLAVWINPDFIGRLVSDGDGTYRAFDRADRLIGTVRAPLDLPTVDLRDVDVAAPVAAAAA